jgi:DNA-binding response OmpR family regulator
MDKLPKKILVVDDDPDIGLMLKTLLEFYGYSVTATERAEKTEDILRADQYNLLIMDMLLSGINGVDICGRLKKDELLSHIPVLMISAHSNARELCLNGGASDFISKPFDIQEILSKIKHLVAQ